MGLNELEHMGRIMREALLVQLPAIETVDEEFECTKQRFRAAREASRPAGQAVQSGGDEFGPQYGWQTGSSIWFA